MMIKGKHDDRPWGHGDQSSMGGKELDYTVAGMRQKASMEEFCA